MPIDRVRIKELGPWLAEPKPFWVGAGVIVGAIVVDWIVIGICPRIAEPTIRMTGGALQLFGIGTVAWGISETRRLFGYQPLVSVVKEYLRRFPLVRRRQVINVGVGEIVGAADRVSASGWIAPPVSGSIETRVEVLEKQVVMLRERADNIDKRSEEQVRKTAADIGRETTVRQEEEAAIKKRLEATATGGIHITAIGAAWLFVGVILGTVSPEIASWVR
jgi:hypothetical protein